MVRASVCLPFPRPGYRVALSGALGLSSSRPSARCALALLCFPRGHPPRTLASLRLEGGDARLAGLAGRFALLRGRAEPNVMQAPLPLPEWRAFAGPLPEQAPRR